MDKVDISIVIPVYNVGSLVERCVESIVKQKNHQLHFEIILIDDGSTDDSGKICDKLAQNNKLIRVIHKKNEGTGFARNTGMAVTYGTYLYFCDPDDYIGLNFFSSITRYLNKKNDLIMFGYWDENPETGEKTLFNFQREYKYNQYEFRKEFIKLFKTKMLYTLWNKLYRKKFIEENQITFSNIPMGQDTRFNIEVYKKIETCQVSKMAFYHYIIGRANSSTTRYRSNRTNLKLQEYNLIAGLLVLFNNKDKYFLKTLKKLTLLDGAMHIAKSNLDRSSMKEKLKELVENEEFDEILKDEKINRKIEMSLLLLKYKLFGLYLTLKK
ncbi:glycosyltransferase family 2 protein [Liquorilactobacillus hordei]|uniref:glycosyltransferase family 2 protein n=1 Tax=Liquorilactobacillus hordei TaxID=468911 RepID=UPI001CBCD997|nr:glycosyltransferase family 2 protein [Liquorilactobacillus hordei]MBZ2405257.1 hypothetical protein [Liquorilactobacillus hordei]